MLDDPIELGLARPLDPTAPPLARLADQLLEFVGELAAERQTLDASLFRRRLQQYRHDLATAAVIDRVAAECAAECREFFRRSAMFASEREKEINGLIETLTTAIDKLAGEAVSVNRQLTGHTDRFHTLVELEDIRDLKRRISTEVTALNQFVSEKQQREEAYYSKLNKRIDLLQARLVETEEAAALDPLTQIANRGTFDQSLRRWIARHAQDERPFVLALFDIDNFKRVNDTYGHVVGDRVLLAAAQALSSRVRGDDLVARYGGEEFAVLIAGSNLRQAEPRLADILRAIAAGVYKFEFQGNNEQLSYTMSAGATENAAGDTPEVIVRRSDEALYEAKHRGKNCVVCRKVSLFSRILGG